MESIRKWEAIGSLLERLEREISEDERIGQLDRDIILNLLRAGRATARKIDSIVVKHYGDFQPNEDKLCEEYVYVSALMDKGAYYDAIAGIISMSSGTKTCAACVDAEAKRDAECPVLSACHFCKFREDAGTCDTDYSLFDVFYRSVDSAAEYMRRWCRDVVRD